MQMNPVTVEKLPMNAPESGIYLFSEEDEHLYVGRSNTIRKRLQIHCRPSSNHNKAAFAFRLAREISGKTEVTYTKKGSRSALEKDPEFSTIFDEQKARIRNMSVRYVLEPDPIKQALLEMYASISLSTPHNDFNNH